MDKKPRIGKDSSHWKGGKLTTKCKQCGNEFEVYQKILDKGCGKFCCKKCYSNWQSENCIGANSNNWKGLNRTVKCAYCGQEFITSSERIKIGKGKFCSNKCYGKWRSKTIKGEKHPNWKGGNVSRICNKCGNEFSVSRTKIKVGRGKFCSKECYWESLIDTNISDEERELSRDYPEYREWRKRVFKRDKYTCQYCKKYGGELNAHHIIAFSKDSSLRVDISNGITLCRQCHINEHIKQKKSEQLDLFNA
jgi:hypothetical protein